MNKTIAILGASGQGKTSIALSLQKLLLPDREPSAPSNAPFIFAGDGIQVVDAFSRYSDWPILATATTVIIAVSAADGPLPETREALVLAKHFMIPSVYIFITKIDAIEDLDILDLVEAEVREIACRINLSSELKVIRGSSTAFLNPEDKTKKFNNKCFEQLISELKSVNKQGAQSPSDILAVAVRNFSRSSGDKIKAGFSTLAHELCSTTPLLYSGGKVMKVSIDTMQIFGKTEGKIPPRSLFGANMHVSGDEAFLRPGDMLLRGPVKMSSSFSAKTYFFERHEGGKRGLFSDGFMCMAMIGSVIVPATFKIPLSIISFKAGDSPDIQINTNVPVPSFDSDNITFIDGGRAIGIGKAFNG